MPLNATRPGTFLPEDNPTRRGDRGWSCGAATKASGGRFATRKRTPRATRVLCGGGGGSRVGRGTSAVFAAQQPVAMPGHTRRGKHRTWRFKQTKVSAVGRHGWEWGLRATQTCRQGRFRTDEEHVGVGVGPPARCRVPGRSDATRSQPGTRYNRSWLAGAHATSEHSHAVDSHLLPRPARVPAEPGLDKTPSLLLPAIKVWDILSALLHSLDGRIKRPQEARVNR